MGYGKIKEPRTRGKASCWTAGFCGKLADACSQTKSLPAPDPVWEESRLVADAAELDARKTC